MKRVYLSTSTNDGLLLLFLSQENNHHSYLLEGSYFYGNIYNHNSDISHLIQGHPTGVFLSFDKKTFGLKEWQKKYNFPDWGFSLVYKDLKNKSLGENYGLYANYNFYLFKEKLTIKSWGLDLH